MAGQTTKPEDKRLVVLQEKAAKGNATAQNEVTTASHFASKHRLHRFSSGMCSFVLHDLALLSASQHCPLARFPVMSESCLSVYEAAVTKETESKHSDQLSTRETGGAVLSIIMWFWQEASIYDADTLSSL